MKPNFTDERGTITDLLVTPEYSVTHITFNEGAVRGNHYHKETTQIDVVLSGKLLCKYTAKPFPVFEKEVVVGDEIKHLPKQAHAYKAIEPSEMISICWGVRKGEDYSKDTYKLDTPLI